MRQVLRYFLITWRKLRKGLTWENQEGFDFRRKLHSGRSRGKGKILGFPAKSYRLPKADQISLFPIKTSSIHRLIITWCSTEFEMLWSHSKRNTNEPYHRCTLYTSCDPGEFLEKAFHTIFFEKVRFCCD